MSDHKRKFRVGQVVRCLRNEQDPTEMQRECAAMLERASQHRFIQDIIYDTAVKKFPKKPYAARAVRDGLMESISAIKPNLDELRGGK